MTSRLSHVGVIGGGRMGAGIAHAFLLAGADVVLIDTGTAAVESARERVVASLAASQKRGSIDDTQRFEDRLVTTEDQAALARSQLVVEAVPERLEMKSAVLAAIEPYLGKEAVLASNTSSLPITAIGEALLRPNRFLGLHFFNPVPASTLVELVVGDKTADDVVAMARGWIRDLGKADVVVKDSPGFATSRLGVALALEAMRMVEEGVASAEDIDVAMEQGYRHRTGPLRTTDLVGLDVRLAIAEHLERELGSRFAPPQILKDKVARGELGQKADRGFFDWPQHEP